MKSHYWHTTSEAGRLVDYLTRDLAWCRWWRGMRPSQILGQRKRRLLAVTCVRAIWPLLKEGGQERRWVDLAETCADGLISHRDLPVLCIGKPTPQAGVSDAEAEAQLAAAMCVAHDFVTHALYYVMGHSNCAAAFSWPFDSPNYLQERLRINQRHCTYIRDLVGDPFNPVPQGWAERFRGSARIMDIAMFIYRERSFKDMPALADALEKEGCAIPQVLQHCRSGTEHIRGCWVLDDLLGFPA